MIEVSIIIPSFNRADVISETLNSVQKQSYIKWECIIVDDGSTDETIEVIKKYLDHDNRFKLFKRPSGMLKGANSCRNYGYLKSKGKYVKFLDSDDLITSDCLDKQVNILESSSHLQVCLSYGRYFHDGSEVLQEFWSRNTDYPDFLLGHITNQIRWQTADPLWRKKFFKTLPFKEGLMNSQEWLMHGEALAHLQNDEIYNLKETFTLIRRGNQRMSSNQSSNYYKNQKVARQSLFLYLFKFKRTRFIYFYELFKQIFIYYYWQLKQKK